VTGSVAQAPSPLQCRVVNWEATQRGAAQAVSVEGKLQLPSPLQLPAQVVLPPHSWSGSSPAGTSVHRPSFPGRAQLRQMPLHRASQQTWSAQWSLAQSPSPVQR